MISPSTVLVDTVVHTCRSGFQGHLLKSMSNLSKLQSHYVTCPLIYGYSHSLSQTCDCVSCSNDRVCLSSQTGITVQIQQSARKLQEAQSLSIPRVIIIVQMLQLLPVSDSASASAAGHQSHSCELS